jgi:DNA-binding transcriptional LysR family regulator
MIIQSCMHFQSAAIAGISIERLVTLCTVIQAGGITAAVGSDATRQSQFSRQLKELEKALGTRLFDRVGKNLRVNENGRRVALAAQTFFGSLDDVINAATAKAEMIRFGAGEAVLRWLVMPHLSELMSGDPPLKFEVTNLRTEMVLHEIRTGGIDLGIIRTELAIDEFQSELLATFNYVLAIPRTLLRSREGAEVFEGRPIAFAELAGDGFFTKSVKATAAALGLNLRPVLQAESFSLLISAVESGTACAFLPHIAAKSLPEERFALVSAEGMQTMNRSLSLVWKSEVVESRAPVRRALTRLRRVLAATPTVVSNAVRTP